MLGVHRSLLTGREADVETSFQAFDALQHSAFRVRRRRQQHACAHDLEQQPRRRGTTHLTQPGVHRLGVARQGCRPDALGLVPHALDHVGGGVDETALPGVGHRAHEDQIAEAIQEVDGEAARIVTRVHDLFHRSEQRGTVLRGQGVDRFVDQRDIGDSEEHQRPGILDTLVPRAGEQLVEHAERVTRRPPTGPNDQRIHRILDRHVLFGADTFHQPAHRDGREQPERIVVRPTADGRQHLLRLRGGEHEDQMLRGLLDDLEQRVESGRGDHVRLVHDEHAVARLGRGVERPIPKLSCVVDTAVAGGVELDHIEVAGTTGRQGHARRADTTRRRRRALDAIERASQDARRRRLAAPARAGEQVGVIDAAGIQGDGQRLGDVLLAHHFRERRWTVLPVQGHVEETTDVLRQSRIYEPALSLAAFFAAFLNSRTCPSDSASTTSAMDRLDPSSP
ncbi:hypothetical protein RhoFasK5_00795|nr:hypothetical protein [Rhodococcus kroppenstedtii]